MKYTIHKVKGYTIILVPNNTKTVHINACIKTGKINETKQNAGIHHLVEHILTESWKPCGKQTCSSYWEKKGVSMNAHTHLSYLNFHVNGLIEDMDEMMEYMIDIITKPFFKKSTLEIEKHAVLNELLIRLNNPEYKLINAFNKEFLINGHTSDYELQIKNLKGMTMKKIRDFYEKINKEIIFVISGPKKMPDFKENYSFKETKEEYFTYSNKIIYVPYKQKSTTLTIGMHVPKIILHKLSACIYVLHTLLFQKLRVEMKMIYGISINLETLPAPYIIVKSTIETKHTQTVYNTIIETFEKYKKEPFPQEYIDGMKKADKLDDYNRNFTSTFMANYVLTEYLKGNGEIISLETKAKDIQKMTAKEFMKIMSLLNIKDVLVVYQGPEKINLI